MQRLTVLFACILLVIPTCGFALPPRPGDVSGSIEFEADAERKNPFPALQDKIISSIKSGSLGTLAQSELVYLNSAYLYCTVNKGTCPEILDALLVADLANSKAQNKASCPLLENFWKQWIENQFEERQRYLGKISFFSQTNEFNAKKRNNYIKCRETIAQILAGQQTAAPAQEVNAKAVAVLEQIKIAVPNVIEAVGAQSRKATVVSTPQGATRAQAPAGAPPAGMDSRRK